MSRINLSDIWKIEAVSGNSADAACVMRQRCSRKRRKMIVQMPKGRTLSNLPTPVWAELADEVYAGQVPLKVRD